MAATLQTILLATDGSPSADEAARVAGDLARRAGGALHLVNVWQFIPNYTDAPIAGGGETMLYETYEQVGRETLARVAEALQGAGITVAGQHLRQGRSVDEVAAAAAELQANLIVIGSRGLGTVQRLILGSVAEGVVHNASCPVLVVRGGADAWPPARVVVGEDGSPNAQAATELAASIAQLYGAHGVLVRTFAAQSEGTHLRETLLERIIPDRHEEEAAAGQRNDEAIGRAEQELAARTVALTAQFGTRPDVQVATGAPAEVLLATAEAGGGSALIVVGSRGLGTFQRLRLGSVSTAVLHGAAGSVLVVPA